MAYGERPSYGGGHSDRPSYGGGRGRGGPRREGGFRPRREGGFRPREREMHKAICSDCKQECEVPFKPSGDRPVYCRECFNKRKEGGMGAAPAPRAPAAAPKPKPADVESEVEEVAEETNDEMEE